MKDHTVELDTANSPTTFQFAPVFNVAVPFIDRHIEEGRGDKIAIRDDSGDITYRSLAEDVNRCGNVLKSLGLDAGDRVVMIVKDGPAFLYLFWGAIKAGYVPVPVNTLLRAKDFQYLIENSACRALVYSPEFSAEVLSAVDALSSGPAYVLAAEGGEGTVVATMAGVPGSLEPSSAAPDDDCFWLYSSGSTGPPKGAVHAHKSMVVTSQLYGVDVLGMGEADVCFSAAKLFFAYGLGNAITFPLWVGAQAVFLAGRPTPESVFDVIARYRPNIFFGVPTLYAAALNALESRDADLSSVRVCISAGEPLPPNILRRWKDRTGLDILDSLGTTEILHSFVANRADDLKPGTTGRLVAGYEARIVDEEGRDVVPEEPGKLMIRGDSLFKYYWGQPKKTAESLIDGWLATGDTYHLDEEGYFVCGGRSDDMMKVGGIWCSPVEIEARLIDNDKVLEAAVVGRADDNDLIKPEAHVVLKNAADASDDLAAELLQHCKSGLAPYKYPRWFNFVDDLPKTATGKIQRFKLRAG
jgi:benzoate-CoA ligase family protein